MALGDSRIPNWVSSLVQLVFFDSSGPSESDKPYFFWPIASDSGQLPQVNRRARQHNAPGRVAQLRQIPQFFEALPLARDHLLCMMQA